MPKLKTKSSAKKRFKISATGKVISAQAGKKHGMKSIRLPWDDTSSGIGALVLKPWLTLMKSRLRKHGINHNDVLLGLDETGYLDSRSLISILNNLRASTSELMCHPATGPWEGMDPLAQDYRHDLEYEALIDQKVIDG